MRIKVSYVALIADVVGKREEVIDVGDGITLSELLNHIMSKYPKLKELSKEVRVTAVVNSVSNELSQVLKEGDEVVILPPASGG